jgi:hypothetical protein
MNNALYPRLHIPWSLVAGLSQRFFAKDINDNCCHQQEDKFMKCRLLLMALAGAASLCAVVTPVIAQQSKPVNEAHVHFERGRARCDRLPKDLPQVSAASRTGQLQRGYNF